MTTKKMRVPPAEELLAQARAATLQIGTCGMCGHCGLNRTSGKFVDLCRNVASLQMGNPVPRNAPACPQYVERTTVPHGFVVSPAEAYDAAVHGQVVRFRGRRKK